MTDPRQRLHDALGDATDLTWVGELPAADQERLATLISETIEREDRQIDEDMASSLEHLPRLMRRPVKKLLGL